MQTRELFLLFVVVQFLSRICLSAKADLFSGRMMVVFISLLSYLRLSLLQMEAKILLLRSEVIMGFVNTGLEL